MLLSTNFPFLHPIPQFHLFPFRVSCAINFHAIFTIPENQTTTYTILQRITRLCTRPQTVKMTRGETIQTKCHYKGSNDDFIIFIDDVDTYNKWKTDKTIPMAHFISSFKIFQTNK